MPCKVMLVAITFIAKQRQDVKFKFIIYAEISAQDCFMHLELHVIQSYSFIFLRVVKFTWKASSSLSAFFTPISIILAFFCKASSSLFKVSLTFFSSANPSSMSNLKSEPDCYHGILKLLSNLSN